MATPYHIHFGAGKLGLGLVLPILKDLNVGIAIFQRPGSQQWEKLEPDEDIHFSINSQHQIDVKYITENFRFFQ
jgi:hypothetical protein